MSVIGASCGSDRTSREAPEDSLVAVEAAGALQERYSGPSSCRSTAVAAARGGEPANIPKGPGPKHY